MRDPDNNYTTAQSKKKKDQRFSVKKLTFLTLGKGTQRINRV